MNGTTSALPVNDTAFAPPVNGTTSALPVNGAAFAPLFQASPVLTLLFHVLFSLLPGSLSVSWDLRFLRTHSLIESVFHRNRIDKSCYEYNSIRTKRRPFLVVRTPGSNRKRPFPRTDRISPSFKVLSAPDCSEELTNTLPVTSPVPLREIVIFDRRLPESHRFEEMRC